MASNAGATVLRGDDLQALADNPDELAADLQALAGPAAGPNSGQFFVDGFTSGGGLAPELDSDNQPVIGPGGQPVEADISSIEAYQRTLQFQRFGLPQLSEKSLPIHRSKLIRATCPCFPWNATGTRVGSSLRSH